MKPSVSNYYCIPSSHFNFPCALVDEQIPEFLGNIQVAPEALPPIRQAYLADVGRYIGGRRQEKVALEAALQVIAEIQARYIQQDVHNQRAILRHVVGKVVINEQGRIMRLELQPPFTYLRALAGENGRPQRKREKRSSGQRSRPEKTKSSSKAGCSLEVSFCDPGRTRTYDTELKRLLFCH